MSKLSDELRPFDNEIVRIETIKLYLGLELKKYEDMLAETKKARIRRIKQLTNTNKENKS